MKFCINVALVLVAPRHHKLEYAKLTYTSRLSSFSMGSYLRDLSELNINIKGNPGKVK